MIQPVLSFDPTASITFLELLLTGAVGAQTINSDNVPPGINRVILAGSFYHGDGANPHILQCGIMSPSGSFFGIADDAALASLVANTRSNFLKPFIVPSGWHIRVYSLDGIAAGAALSLSAVYLDYLVQVG